MTALGITESASASLIDTVGVCGPVGPAHSVDISITGTFVATVDLQRYINGGWKTIKQYTAPAQDSPSVGVRASPTRLICSSYSSGTVSAALQQADAGDPPAPNNTVSLDPNSSNLVSLNTSTLTIGSVVPNAAAAAGGISTTARLASAAASTNATNVKTSAGRIYGVQGKNVAAYDVYLVLYDSATNPPVPGSTTIRKKILIPAGAAFSLLDNPLGYYFANGIGYAFTKLAADADTTALAAGDILAFNLDYV